MESGKLHGAEKKLVGKTVWMLVAVAAWHALPASANINRVDGLHVNVLANTTYHLDADHNGTIDFNLSNVISSAGTDYYGTTFYNRNVTISGAGANDFVGGQAVPGYLIGPSTSMTNSEILDQTQAYFSTTVVSSYQQPYSYSCGLFGLSTCTDWNTVYVYGSVGGYTISDTNLGNNMLFVFKFADTHGQTDYGWLDLSVADPGTSYPYQFTLNGYGWDNTGASVQAGAVATVPEPSNLLLMATGVLGIALYRRKTNNVR